MVVNALLLIGFILSFIITYISIPSIIKVSEAKNLVTIPNERSVHTSKIPNLGGVAIFAGLIICTLILPQKMEWQINFYIAGFVIIFFIGVKDDILVIAPLTKFLGQLTAAMLIVVGGNLIITDLHGFFDIHKIPAYLGVPLTILVTVTVINSFNFIDGVDGLAASLGIISSLAFGVWFYLVGLYTYSIISVSLCGALFAFLRFNLFSKTEKIFLGDTGSQLIGIVMAIFAVKFCEYNLNKNIPHYILPAPSVALGILIIPIFDLMRVVFVRLVQKRSPYSPDKNHIHHLLLDLNLSHKQVVGIISLANICFVIVSFIGAHFFPIRRLLLIILILAMIFTYIPSIIKLQQNKNNDEKNK